MWAITHRTRRPDLLPKPVYFTTTKAGVLEKKMPEKSEAYITYHTRTYPVAYVDKLNWDVYYRIVQSDCATSSINKRLSEDKAKREIAYRAQSKDRWREARSYMNWHARTNIMAD